MKDYAHYGENVIPYTQYAMYAAYLRKYESRVDVEILECPAHRITNEMLTNEIIKINPQVIVMGILYAPQSEEVTETFAMIRETFPHIVTIVEGPHFGAVSQETLNSYPQIDYVISGEVENTLLETVRMILDEEINPETILGLTWRRDGSPVKNGNRPQIKNLDDLPLPAYDLMDLDKNLYRQFYTLDRYVRIYSSRGCKAKCTFCHRWPHFSGTYRSRSGESMANELIHLHVNYGIEIFEFYDADFGEDPLMVRNFCNTLIASGVMVKLWFSTRADNIIMWEKENLFPLLMKAGAKMCGIGVEYYKDESLAAMGKNETTAQVKEAFNLTRKYGLVNGALTIMGWPEETRESTEELYQYITGELDPDVFILQMLQPLPGTTLWRQLKNDPSLEKEFKYYDRFHPVMSTKYLSRQELGSLYLNLLGRFYGNPENVEPVLNSDNQLGAAAMKYFSDRLTPKKEKALESERL